MGSKFRFLVLYFISWVFFFEILRAVFLLYHSNKANSLSALTIIRVLTNGLRMDMSISAYLLAPVCLLTILSLFIAYFRRIQAYKIYTAIILLLTLLISLVDLEIYKAWGFRIDSTPIKFLYTPREALASMSHLPLFLISLGFIIIYFLLYRCFSWILDRIFFETQYSFKLITGIALLVFSAALIIPIRGGFQLAPLNQSSVYFSTNNFANHAAINPAWNFFHSVFSKENVRENPYKYLASAEVHKTIDSLYQRDTLFPHLVRTNDQPINVLLVIWESFTEKAISITRDGIEITPEFNQLKKEGIFFSNLYASGDRTNKGIPAILSGYPSMPNTSIIHSPGKLRQVNSLSTLFVEKGYRSIFFYGGEPEFANIKSYLLNTAFDPIIGRDDFASEDMNSKWGAHDGVVMERVLADLKKQSQPFFSTWLTLSSHEPFETPVPTVINGNDIESKFLNSLHYTDQVLGTFIKQSQQQSWWNNTLVIITGDHGHPSPVTGHKADNFRVPMLWLGGALEKKGLVIDKVMSQIDIAATVACQFNLNDGAFPFSKNVLSTKTGAWAFFSFTDGFGFVNSKGRLVYDNVGRRMIEKDGATGPNEEIAGKSLMQYYYQDFIQR